MLRPRTPRAARSFSWNGWRHSLVIVRALHERRPELTFDCTTKVEHVLEHAGVSEEMAASGLPARRDPPSSLLAITATALENVREFRAAAPDPSDRVLSVRVTGEANGE